jgi:hypothetical protein
MTVTLCACGNDDKKDAGASGITPIDAAFLTSADMKKSATLGTAEQADVVSDFTENDYFYDNMPDTADDSECTQNKLKPIVLHVATAGVLKAGAKVDVTDCMNESADPADTAKFTAATMRFYAEFHCDDQDLTKYDGQTFGDVIGTKQDISDDCSAGSALTNVAVDFTYAGTSDGKKVELTAAFYNFDGKEPLGLCSWTTANGIGTYGAGCVSLVRKLTSSTKIDGQAVSNAPDDYSRYAKVDVKGKDDNTTVWYDSGHVDIQNDDWTGTVTYNGGSTPPTYSIQNGPTGDPVTGTVKQASLGLAAPAPLAKAAGVHAWDGALRHAVHEASASARSF